MFSLSRKNKSTADFFIQDFDDNSKKFFGNLMGLLPLAHCTLEVRYSTTSSSAESMASNESPLMVMLCAILQGVVLKSKMKFQKVWSAGGRMERRNLLNLSMASCQYLSSLKSGEYNHASMWNWECPIRSLFPQEEIRELLSTVRISNDHCSSVGVAIYDQDVRKLPPRYFSFWIVFFFLYKWFLS